MPAKPVPQKTSASLSPIAFYLRGDATSLAPGGAALIAAAIVLSLGVVLPIGVALEAGEAPSAGAWICAAVSALFAALIPKRLVFGRDGFQSLNVFGRNRRLAAPGESRWWGRYLSWDDAISVTLEQNNQRFWLQQRLGTHRFVLRARRGGTHEIHRNAPVFSRFGRLVLDRIPDKCRDVSDEWWRWLQ